MPKTKISEFSATPANNTDIDSINISEGCAPSGINDAIRELMAQLKDFQTGAVGDTFNGPIGSSTASTGAFTTLTTTGTINNLTVGRGAGAVSTNTAVGASALAANTSGSANTALGNSAASTATTAIDIVAIGNRAGRLTTVGVTAVGSYALDLNTTGANNTGIGNSALGSNTTGGNNSSLGWAALFSNTTGSSNTSSGYQALKSVTVNSDNTAVGANAARDVTGSANSAFGSAALIQTTSGSYNVAVGQGSLFSNTTASNNTAVGYQAGYAITTGQNNTFLGYQAGTFSGNQVTTGTGNTYLGYGACASGTAVTSELVISAGAVVGKGSSTGFIYPSTGGVYQGNNSATWSVTSDQRLKKNIVDNNTGLEKITQIQVRNFEYRLEDEITELPKDQAIKNAGVQFGVIAQEIQVVLPDCVKTESTGVMSINTDNLIWYAINAIKELKAEVDSLKAQIQGA
jgi:hypothetical protein